jgi:hypothetical protein
MSSTAIAAVVAKLAGLGLPAKAVGVAVALGVVGGAPAVAHVASQDDAPAAVESTTAPNTDPTATATPTAEPTATPTAEPTATPTAEPTATPTAEPTATPTPTKPGKGPGDLPSAATFGQSVAADARDGGVNGQEIAARAREKSASETAREHRHVKVPQDERGSGKPDDAGRPDDAGKPSDREHDEPTPS